MSCGRLNMKRVLQENLFNEVEFRHTYTIHWLNGPLEASRCYSTTTQTIRPTKSSKTLEKLDKGLVLGYMADLCGCNNKVRGIRHRTFRRLLLRHLLHSVRRHV
jgi:hypothetical protein